MIKQIKYYSRLISIACTLAKHNALFPNVWSHLAPSMAFIARLISKSSAPGRDGERLGAALTDLGPSFIKLGQLLSTRADLVGDEIAEDLASLQDRLPPFPSDQAKQTIEHELGGPIEQFFDEFDDTPVAAASIAQVHFAKAGGHDVAIKILRPDIEYRFLRDLDLLSWLAHKATKDNPKLERLRLGEAVETFRATVLTEMDLRLEAAAASELQENFKDDTGFRVPNIDWDRTTGRILTLERINGIPIDEIEALKASGFEPDKILTKAANVFFTQVFCHGFFHADMHPGNIFVDQDGILVAIDFGIMGRLDRPTRIYLADMLRGFLTRDYDLVAKVHFDAGYVPQDQSIALFAQACRSIGEPLHGKPMNEISLARLLAQLFRITEQFNMQTQPHLLLLQKTMLSAEGMGRTLNPSSNMWEMARPLIENWMRQMRGPEAILAEKIGHLDRLMHQLPAALNGLAKIPEMEKRFLDHRKKAARPLISSWVLWSLIFIIVALKAVN